MIYEFEGLDIEGYPKPITIVREKIVCITRPSSYTNHSGEELNCITVGLDGGHEVHVFYNESAKALAQFNEVCELIN